VVAVCPGLTRTPIFDADMVDRFGIKENNSLAPEDVAKGMTELIELGKYEGGTILEVSAVWTRTIGTFNIEPPKSDGAAIPKEVFEKNIQPVVDILEKERGVDT